MKNKPLLFLLSVCGLLAISARGENPPAKVIFEQYMNQAQTFADNYPREKAVEGRMAPTNTTGLSLFTVKFRKKAVSSIVSVP